MEEELKQAKAKIAELEEANTKLTSEVEDATKTKEQLENEKKDLSLRLQEKGSQFKKLRDLTKEEKEKLSQKELELMQRQEKLEEEQEAWVKRQEDERADNVKSWRENSISKLAGDDKDMKEKIEHHMGRFNDEIKSPEDAQRLAQEAYMIANPGQSPDPVGSAVNAQGASDRQGKTTDFAGTEEGKGLAASLNLKSAQPKKEE